MLAKSYQVMETWAKSYAAGLLTALLSTSLVGCHVLQEQASCETVGYASCFTGCQPASCQPEGCQSEGCLTDSQTQGVVQLCEGRAGGAKACDRTKDFGNAAVPAPPGTYVNGWNDAMICSARRQNFLISRHEWFSGGKQLGPEGRQHAQAIAGAMLSKPEQKVLIEAEPVELLNDESYENAITRTDRLNSNRQQLVVQQLLDNGVLDAEQRVVVVPIDRVGLRGVEAPGVYNRLLQGSNGNRNGQGGGGIGTSQSSGSGSGGTGGGGFF